MSIQVFYAPSAGPLTLTPNADGFSIAGGTTPRTLTVTAANVTLNQSLQTTDTPQFTRLGIGGAAGAASPLTITGGTVTADTPLINASQTWNNAGVTFTGLKLNVTSTASAAASLLMDLQVGAASQWKVNKSGVVTQVGGLLFTSDNSVDIGASGATRPRIVYTGTAFRAPDGTAAAPALSFASVTNAGWFISAGVPEFAFGGAAKFAVGNNLQVVASAGIGWTPAEDPGVAMDTILARDGAARVLALKSTTNPNEFRVYGTTTGPKYLSLSHNGTNGIINNNSGQLRLAIGTLSLISTGGAPTVGTATLVGGTVTVTTTAATATCIILLTRKTSGGTIGTAITYTISAGTSFTITSDNILDTSVFVWEIVETY